MKKSDFTSIFLICSLCAAGLFHEFITCIAGAALCVYLCIYAYRNKTVKIYFNLCSLAVFSVVLFYALSCFRAVDKGLAVTGIFKVLPLLLFSAVIMQQQKDAGEYLKIVPPVAAVMTVISSVLMQIPSLEKWFSVSGRLSGFFQYSNTFALFLLIAFIIIGTKEKLEKTDFAYIPIILFGIFYSGSRTVFVLFVVSVIGIIIFNKNKKYKLVLGGATLVAIAVVLIYVAVTDNFRTIGRFLTMSFTESTFVGRLLYFTDALPVILKHPFGMGYLGYYFFQQSVQTGVYTVKFIHNDFLQLMLDIGWIPTLILIAAILRSFFRRGASLQKRMLILIISAHCCFDFNLQYIAVFMLFLLLLDCKDGKEKEFAVNRILNISLTCVFVLLFVYFGLAQGLTYFRQYRLSDKIYPMNTLNHIEMLIEDNGAGLDEKLADKVIKNNGHVAIAYDVKAKLAYSEGDFEKMIEYKEKSIETAPFSTSTYSDYCYMLINGIFLYEQYGDDYSAQVCRETLLSVVQRLNELPEKLSKFGKMIEDQPDTVLPDDINTYVEGLTNEK